MKTAMLSALLSLTAIPVNAQPAASPPSILYYVCPSAPSPADTAVLSILNDGLASAVNRTGGTTFTGARRGTAPGCANVDEVVSALQVQQRDRPNQTTFVLLDSDSLTRLAERQGLLSGLNLQVMNLRLFTRPLYVFESASAALRTANQPNVGVYSDQEIAPAALRTLLQNVLRKPIAIVPFQNVAEMARCLARGGSASTGRLQCPAEIGWAVIVEQDASLVLDAFNAAYQTATGTPPQPFSSDNLQLGVQLGSSRPLQPGIDLVVSASQAIPSIPDTAARQLRSARMPLIPRSEDKELVQQEARQSSSPSTGWGSSFWAWVGSFGIVHAAGDDVTGPLRHPYPIVLTNQNPPDDRLRAALSDSYLRVLSDSSMGTPCTAVAERIHRAYLFNALLDDPGSEAKKLGLGSELLTASGDARNLADVFGRLSISRDLSEWKKQLGPPPPSPDACPKMPNERFPDDRVFFSNPNLAFQYRAMEHIRRGNLDGAALCLRLAVASRAVPDCHTPERSTYSFYYNPYFYFAVQQVNLARPAR